MASSVQALAEQTNIQQTSTAGQAATSQTSQTSVARGQSTQATATNNLNQLQGQDHAHAGVAQDFQEFSRTSIDGPILLSLRPGSFILAFKSAPGIFEENNSIAFDTLCLLVFSGAHAGPGSASVPILSRPTLRTLHNRLALLQTRADEILSTESVCTSDARAVYICARINNLFEDAQISLEGKDFENPSLTNPPELLLLKGVFNDYKNLAAAQKKGPFYIHFLLNCLSREPGALHLDSSNRTPSSPPHYPAQVRSSDAS